MRVGGTALAALSIRGRSDDLDVYMSELDDTAVSTVQEVFAVDGPCTNENLCLATPIVALRFVCYS